MAGFIQDDAATQALRGFCIAPFFDATSFGTEGFIDGRLCQQLGANITCCLPCPITDWVYPDAFNTLSEVADWASVVGALCCVSLLLSYAFLPVESTNRHYLSISIVIAVILMNLGFIIPLAGQPEQCVNEITPHGMESSTMCAASATALLFGGFAGVMWVFLRSVCLHLQICWQQSVGRTFMIFAHVTGWLIPAVVVALALVFSGVSFRFGATCHINHKNSLADFWIPILIFAGLTALLQFATFGYCIKVYLASLVDNSASTDHSTPGTYPSTLRSMTPRQAYRRVKRVIALQWKGIAIVLIIITDVIFFSVVFVFQDNTVEEAKNNPEVSRDWLLCLATAINTGGSKDDCLSEASRMVVGEETIIAVLLLLAINGIFLFFLLGRWSMVTGWIDLFRSFFSRNKNNEFVSVDARYDKNDQLHLSMSPISPNANGRKTPDYFGHTARYNPPARSFSSPRPPTSPTGWDFEMSYAPPAAYKGERTVKYDDMNPLGMNKI